MNTAELARRLENILRIGTVAEVSGTRCRVTLGAITTHWMPWFTQRAGNDATWWSLSVGEQVMVLSPSGELAAGVVLTGLYSNAKPSPSTDPNKAIVNFENGTTIVYDKAAELLSATIIGDADIEITGDLQANIQGSANLEVAENLTANIDGHATLTVKQNLEANVEGDAALTIDGNLSAEATAASIIANTTIQGNLTVTGAATLQGGAIITGAITNNGKDVGSAHKHSNGTDGMGNTGAPL